MQKVKNIKVACAIIYSNDKILVTQRGPEMSLPLKWEFPGGKIEEDESALECVVREIKEELGIEITPTGELQEQFFNYGTFSVTLIPLKAIIRSGHIKLTEHIKYMWLRPDELLKLDWAAADKGIVRLLSNSGNSADDKTFR